MWGTRQLQGAEEEDGEEDMKKMNSSLGFTLEGVDFDLLPAVDMTTSYIRISEDGGLQAARICVIQLKIVGSPCVENNNLRGLTLME